MLLAPTISGLRTLLKTSENYLNGVNMCVNVPNHSAFSLDGAIILIALHSLLSRVVSSNGLIAADI